MVRIIIGLTLFFSFVISTEAILRIIMGGNYGNVFNGLPHPLYLGISLFLKFFVPFMVTIVFIKLTKLKERLPTILPCKELFSFGALLMAIPLLTKLWASTVEGGGTLVVLMSYSELLNVPAKVVVFVGAIKLFMSVKPSDKYQYEGV